MYRRQNKNQLIFILVVIFLLYWILSPKSPGKLTTQVRTVYAGSVGPANCGSSVNDNSIGNIAWSNPGNVCVGSNSTTASNLTNSTSSNYLKITNFGFSIPTGAKVQGIQVTVNRSTTANKQSESIDNAVRIVKGGIIGATDRSNGSTWSTAPVTYGSASDLWGESWTVSDINSTNFGLALSAKGNGPKTVNATVYAYVTISVTYNASPNIPTNDLPVDGSTSVSINPIFKVTGSDPESDNLGYKITIYSNSSCTTVVQTNDQADNPLGWSGTNAVCTNSPTGCYTSGTQATYTGQTPLVNNTQYWWRASVRDPDGSNSFRDASGCNSFTTEKLVSLSITTDGAVDYGILSADTSKSTLPAELNDTQTVKNDSQVTENFNIKTSNATGGVGWTIGSLPGSNTFVYEFSTNAGSDWTMFNATDSYQTLATDILVDETRDLDLRITTPTSSSDFQPKTITITVQAVQP